MFIRFLHLTEFKNHSQLKFEFTPSINCFTGPNGIGKTNLLDSIYLLCLTKSFLASSESQNIPHEGTFYSVKGDFLLQKKERSISCKYQSGKKKLFEEDGIAYTKLAEHIGKIPVVIVSPGDQELILGGSEDRRKFIDVTLSQIDKNYLKALSAYTKTLFQRNASLKKFNEKKYFDRDLIAFYDQELIKTGNFIFEERKKWIPELKKNLTRFYKQISNGKEIAEIEYNSDLQNDSFKNLLKESLQQDRILQRTSKGIHKDDLIFTLDGLPAKRYGSQGQQKSYLLSIKLAQYFFLKEQKKCSPILLLDDLFDKLDEHRSMFFLHTLAENKIGQVFITDTNEDRIINNFAKIDTEVKIFNLEKIKNE
ncbi:MAG: DNA replication and repair protein RecF [Chitinophagaceae bacterium]|nr:MAG: DNA replication and repair protein RecF [Chitinophagaceae bacterium]